MSLPISHWPEAAATLARTFGVRGAALRAWHEVRRRSGRFRPSPRHPVAAPGHAEWMRLDADALKRATDPDIAIARAERVLGGEYPAFRDGWEPFPADWLRQPTTGRTAAADAPWWEAEHLDRDFGDIKEVWEPARFAWLYDLVRGYLVTGEARFAQAAVQHVTAWSDASLPFRGLHWSCGQETAIRAIALLYAEANLVPALDARARARLSTVLAASGERIADAIGYAVSQRNNHALSEATGMVMLGTRFLGQHPEAHDWLESGHRWLNRLIPEQIAEDGWYIQHSFTYARLAIEQCVLAEHALRHTGRQLEAGAVERIQAACILLATVADAETGSVPNHGANDGAFVFPATLAAYRDFRPVMTAAAATWRWPMPGDLEPDSEVAVWLNVPSPQTGPAREGGLAVGTSGWASASVGATHVFLRAGRYASRPAHLDPLHLTVRFGGREVIVDAGTFSYNAPPPWNNGLTAAAVHNGPLLDGHEPGIRGPRFLWYQWPEADLVETEAFPDGVRLVAERPGVVRRTVVVQRDGVEVRDEALRPGVLQVTWLLGPGVPTACVHTGDAERKEVRAREGAVEGWVSRHYGERIPSQSVIATSATSSEAAIVTHITTPPDRS